MGFRLIKEGILIDSYILKSDLNKNVVVIQV
jgi:hypothetical protein